MKAPRILVTGANGQVGWELQRTLSCLGEVVAVSRNQLDLSQSQNIRECIDDVRPDVIVNAAAYTAVDKAEEEQDLAMQINGVAPGVLAEHAGRVNALLVHYSTDYVFDGQGSKPFVEQDVTGPLNYYGTSKLAGENNVQQQDANHLILRTSWVYSHRGSNFLRSILRLADEREELGIVADQVGSPTSARLIAEVTAHVISQSLGDIRNDVFESAIYHLVSSGEASWYDFAVSILDQYKALHPGKEFRVGQVRPINTSDYKTAATRPLNSRLNTESLRSKFNVHLPAWDEQLALCIADLC